MDSSCQVDFYLLGNTSLDAPKLACQLALMAWERGHRVAVVTDSGDDAGALDELMWSWPRNRFVPHQRVDQGLSGTAPVTIGVMESLKDADVVINLCIQPVPEPQRFNRLLEIVPQKPEDRQASRQKFRAYRQLGIEPATHNIGK
jgi:DNA polymerase-3 subunit chi